MNAIVCPVCGGGRFCLWKGAENEITILCANLDCEWKDNFRGWL